MFMISASSYDDDTIAGTGVPKTTGSWGDQIVLYGGGDKWRIDNVPLTLFISAPLPYAILHK